MGRRLSSLQAFFIKFIFPPSWIAIFGFMAARQMNAGALKTWPLILVAWLAATAWIVWCSLPLKKVSIDDQNLYVSNYFHEMTVPFSLIGDVTENKWLNHHPITIHFKLPTEYGNQIVFIPPVRLLRYIGSDPIVAELKQLAKIT